MSWWHKLTGQEKPLPQTAPQTLGASAPASCPRAAAPGADILSKILLPEDFAAVGLSGAGAPDVNSDEPGCAYLVYAGNSGATGGIEFDVFFSDDPEAVFATVTAESQHARPVSCAQEVGADDALLETGRNNGRGGKWAGIDVKKGRLVFAISLPDSPQAESQLIALAKLVLARTQREPA